VRNGRIDGGKNASRWGMALMSARNVHSPVVDEVVLDGRAVTPATVGDDVRPIEVVSWMAGR